MKFLIFVLALTLISCSDAAHYRLHFEAHHKKIKYEMEGTADVDVLANAVARNLKDYLVPFNGTLKDETGAVWVSTGSVKIVDPALFNLNKIQVQGQFIHSSGPINYTGIFKVSILDVTKNIVPFKGNLNYGNGKKDDVEGQVTYL